jgi:hypothetical protein
MQQNEAEFREKWSEVISLIMKKTNDRNKELSKPPPDPEVPF